MSRVAAEITPAVANSLLYADIVRTQQDLARSNDDLEQFAYAASHDLQEPLRTITSYIGLIRDRYADALDDTAREFIHYAVDGAERMRTLIDDLLDYSRVETQGRPFQTVNCSRVAEYVLGVLDQAIRQADAEVECSRLPTINGDESQLSRLFQNLIGNALKFRGDTDPHIRVWAELQKDEWTVCRPGQRNRHSPRAPSGRLWNVHPSPFEVPIRGDRHRTRAVQQDRAAARRTNLGRL